MYRSSIYVSTTKSPRSPHPLALHRPLDFLEDFDSDTSSYLQSLQKEIRDSTDTEDDDEDVSDVEREYELLIRRGWTYSVVMVITSILLTKFCPVPALAPLLLLFLFTYPESDVDYAIRALSPWGSGPEDVKTALHRRPSIIHAYDSQAAHGYIHPDMNPHRRFGESLTPAARLVIRQSSEFMKSVVSFTIRYIFIQVGLQLFATIAQHLDARFRTSEDITGLIPRYVANLTSMQNLFGSNGFAGFAENEVFTIKWWYGWISSLTRGLTWRLPISLAKSFGRLLARAVAIPDEHFAGDVKEKIQQFQG